MKIFKKITTTALIFSMALSMTVQTNAAELKEKDIVWIGTNYLSSGRLDDIHGSVEGVYGKNVIYRSTSTYGLQIYFGEYKKKTGFKFNNVTPLAGGKLFFVNENSGTDGYIMDEKENVIYSGLKNVAANVIGKDKDILKTGAVNDRYICGDTGNGLVILDTENGCKVVMRYNGYRLDNYNEIYKIKINGKRHIRIKDKTTKKYGFLWLSQKSGTSGIIATDLAKKAKLLLNKDGEYKIIVPIKGSNDSAVLLKPDGVVIWNGKGKELKGTSGNLLDTDWYALRQNINYKGISNNYVGNKIVFKVQNKRYKYGLVRDDGRILISCRYHGIKAAYKDMAVVEHNNYRKSLVNYKGQNLTSKKYDEIYTFHNGKAVVEDNGKYGIISDKGKELVEPVYDMLLASKLDGNEYYQYNLNESNIKDISDGMIVIKDGNYIYIDKSGKEETRKYDYYNLSKLANSKNKKSSLFLNVNGGKFGIMAANGEELYKAEYDFFGILSKAKGIFSLGIREYDKSGSYVSEMILDKNGEKIFEVNHTKSIKRVSTGEYIVIKDNQPANGKKTEQVLLYDAEGRKITEFKNKWKEVTDYRDGFFIVGDKDENYGIADEAGKIVLPVKYYKLSFKKNCILVEEKYDNVVETGFLVR